MNRCAIAFSTLLVVGCADGVADTEAEPPVPAANASAQNAGETFEVKFETTKGDFVVEVHPEWAPNGAAQFKELVEAEFYDGCRFFRVVPDFMVQFGINGNPNVQAKWRNRTIKDDPVKQSNKRGYVTFATSGPNSRTSQIFINFGDNSFLDGQGFAPFAKVIEGMDVVDKINAEYREQPNQGQIQSRGNKYLDAQFPRLDAVKTARVVEDDDDQAESGDGAANEDAPSDDAS